jgi:predicted nuclease of predicted toxin-antitoxin system
MIEPAPDGPLAEGLASDGRQSAGLAELRDGVDAGRPLLAWVAPPEPECSRALSELARLISVPKQIVRIRAGLLTPDELSVELLEALSAIRGNHPAGAVLLNPFRPLGESRPLVVLLEGCEALLPATARWLDRLFYAAHWRKAISFDPPPPSFDRPRP